jgi:hypothetical protein
VRRLPRSKTFGQRTRQIPVTIQELVKYIPWSCSSLSPFLSCPGHCVLNPTSSCRAKTPMVTQVSSPVWSEPNETQRTQHAQRQFRGHNMAQDPLQPCAMRAQHFLPYPDGEGFREPLKMGSGHPLVGNLHGWSQPFLPTSPVPHGGIPMSREQ